MITARWLSRQTLVAPNPAETTHASVPLRVARGTVAVYDARRMGTIRFCPFCRDAFEDRDTCPDHGLGLVDFTDLPREAAPEAGDAWLPLGPSHGRGWLALGALLALGAFALPMAHLSGQVTVTSTLFEVASHHGKTLWAAAAAALGQLALLYRRRTPDSLRSARIVALLFAVAPAGVVVFVAQGVLRAAAVMSVREGGVEARLGLGVWVMMLSILPGIRGALRLGTPTRRPYRVRLEAE